MRITDIKATNEVLSQFDSSVEEHRGGMGFPEGPLFDNTQPAYLTINTRNTLVVRIRKNDFDGLEDVSSLAVRLDTLHKVMMRLDAVNS